MNIDSVSVAGDGVFKGMKMLQKSSCIRIGIVESIIVILSNISDFIHRY